MVAQSLIVLLNERHEVVDDPGHSALLVVFVVQTVLESIARLVNRVLGRVGEPRTAGGQERGGRAGDDAKVL